jgi:hypothetical protein
MLGLNDPHIAAVRVVDWGEGVPGHEKADPTYVLDLQPDYILSLWEPYFEQNKSRLSSEYSYLIVPTPTGFPVKWLKRK